MKMNTMVNCDCDDCKYNVDNTCSCDVLDISTFGECYTREEDEEDYEE